MKKRVVASIVIGGLSLLLIVGLIIFLLVKPAIVIVPPQKVAVVVPAPDVTPKIPQVVFIGATATPLDLSQNQGVLKDIIVTFSEAMNSSTVNSDTFRVRGPNDAMIDGVITSDITNKIWTFHPVNPLGFDVIYNVTVTTGAKGVSGNALIKNFLWSFTTNYGSGGGSSGGGSSGGGAAAAAPVVPPVTGSSNLSAVNLGTATGFALLGGTGIADNVPTLSAITGNVGVSAAAGSFITGLSCTKVTGTIYEVNAGYTGGFDSNTTCAAPGPGANKTLVDNAVADELTAYNTARGLSNPTATELYTGNLGGQTLTPGLYKWSTPVTIPTSVTLDCQGNASAVFIFQIAQTLVVSNGQSVNLIGSCQAKNIFWQVDTQVTLGTTSVFNGNILSGTAVVINTGATLNGRAFAQSAVTLNGNAVTKPA